MNFINDEEEYQSIFWPNLKNVIEHFLSNPVGFNYRVSFEEMYSYVYKCVCKQMADRLHQDLFGHINAHLVNTGSRLSNSGTPQQYLVNLDTEMAIYMQAVELIAKIFTYMNRFYLESRMQTDLKTALLDQFNQIVIRPTLNEMMRIIQEAQATPFFIPPPVMASLIKNLHILQPELANTCPDVFARFIPNILPPMELEDIPQHIAEQQMVQQELLSQGFQSGDNSRKRHGDDDQMNPPSVR